MAASPSDPSTSSLRWVETGESGSAFGGGFSRGRGRGGRGGRGGGRGGPSRESKANPESRTDRSQAPQERVKPTPSKISTAPVSSDSNERAPSTPRTRNASRRPSRSTPAPIVTQLLTQSTELQTPSSASRTPNRRKRSGTAKSTSIPPKIKVVPESSSVEQRQVSPPTVSHIAPLARDTPPHLANKQGGHSPAEMKSNIDALVERVRAVAMADNRPSTPGSHIDWAGDDDDSLPDLNDWGITTITPSQTISPIIVDGLKPLPEPIAKPIIIASSISPVKVSSPLAFNVSLPHEKSQEKAKQSRLSRESGQSEGTAKRGNARGKNKKQTLPPRPISVSNSTSDRRGGATPTPPFHVTSFSKGKEEAVTFGQVSNGAAHPQVGTTSKVPTKKSPIVIAIDSADVITTPSSAGRFLADSIHASTSGHNALFDSVGSESGLAASIHAPKPDSDPFSAPPTISSYNQPRPPRNEPFTHIRRPASFNSNLRNPRSNNSTPRGPNQHTRNHSSPATASPDGRSPHARPVITGAAMSRLTKTIVSTAPKSAPAISSSTD